jgi:hypothetical protein
MRVMGYPEEEIARITQLQRDPMAVVELVVERVERIIADFDALDSHRRTAVNPRYLVDRLREIVGEPS